MLRTRVAVLRGGPSSEYDVSLITGSGVLSALDTLGYFGRDITISKKGEWLVGGVVRQPEVALGDIDVVFIAMHGAYGEDGTIQKICERLHIPFTGSNSFPSSLAFNKDSTKRVLQSTNLNLPKHVRITKEDSSYLSEIITNIGRSMGTRFVIKPLTSGSSHGVVMVDSLSELEQTLGNTLEQYDECMVEERILGTEATCGVLEGFRNEPYYVLPPIEIIPPSTHGFFAEDVKYTGETEEICPGRFSFTVREKITEAARLAHITLGLTQYSRSDFMVRGEDVYFLEVNTLPGLTPESLFPKAAEAVGLSFPELVRHLVLTAKVT